MKYMTMNFCHHQGFCVFFFVKISYRYRFRYRFYLPLQ